jgi:macrolide transport system ATP-binding/permease protein
MEDFVHDLRHGLRLLVSRPGFAAVAVLSLGLGIGLNTTLFSVVNAILYRPTAVADPDRLVEIYSSAGADLPHFTTSYPDYLSILEGTHAFQGVTAHSFVRGILSTGGKPVLTMGEAVTANYFDVLGMRPALGRGFLPAENIGEGQHPVLVMGHAMWQGRFGGRTDIVGQTVVLSGVPYAVVGVAPAGFSGVIPGLQPEFWVPVMMVDRLSFGGVQATTDNDPGATRIQQRGNRWLFLKGRLAEGRSVEEAQAQVETVFARLRMEHPATNDRTKGTVMPSAGIRFHPMLDGYVKGASAVLLTAVGLVLVIACANVANMQLARGASRTRELALRAAVGASRARLVRQLSSESLVLATAGGALGILVALGATRLLAGLPADALPLPIRFDLRVDGTVLAFAALVSLATTALFGILPAWTASRPSLVPSLKASATGEGPLRRRVTLSDGLVVGQLALSLVLLVAGALLTRGLLAARGTDLGFDPTPLSSLQFNLQMNGYDEERALAFRKRVVAELAALPGVTAVALASRPPLAPDINMEGIRIQGRHQAHEEPTPIDAVSVGPDYFRTIGVPILEGRSFTDDDVSGSKKVVIVNQAFAKRYWPGRSALGQLVHTSGFDQPPHEIVGVARDHKVRSVGEPPTPYMHLLAARSTRVALLVRTHVPAKAALSSLRSAVLKLEPDVVFTEDAPAAEVAATTLAPTRIGAALLAAFGSLALLLAAVGLYGVISYSVTLRTREMGVRMALGAQRADVLRLVLGQGSRLALVGVGVGALLAALVGSVFSALLYGVSSLDPLAYAVAATVLLAVAAAANLVPALTAARVEPMRALRNE